MSSALIFLRFPSRKGLGIVGGGKKRGQVIASKQAEESKNGKPQSRNSRKISLLGVFVSTSLSLF